MLGGLEGETWEHRDMAINEDWCTVLVNPFMSLLSSLTLHQQYWLSWWSSLSTLTMTKPIFKHYSPLTHTCPGFWFETCDLCTFGCFISPGPQCRKREKVGTQVWAWGRKGKRVGWMLGDPEIFSFLSVFSTLFLFPPCQHQTRQD